jgi:hypothetical protein
MKTTHPMQPLIMDEQGIVHFKPNALVRYLLHNGGIDMNHLARLGYDKEDYEQFAQLIGYSVGGFNDLSYVSDEVCSLANEKAKEIQSEKMNSPCIEKIGDGTYRCKISGIIIENAVLPIICCHASTLPKSDCPCGNMESLIADIRLRNVQVTIIPVEWSCDGPNMDDVVVTIVRRFSEKTLGKSLTKARDYLIKHRFNAT